MPELLVVFHSASGSTARLVEAAVDGARDPEIIEATGMSVDVRMLGALEAGVEDVLAADGYLLGTPENFGYMSGALKDFFDRTYYPCLEHTRGRPYGLIVKAGDGGAAAVDAVAPLATGLEWRPVLEPVVASGDLCDDHLAAARMLGATLAGGIAAGIW
ncbi:MAG: NAD(P)H-dependent oxidoreductase [Actinomycetota bacterium]|nr:NAD(P)H-dependent oxidoreductase [Actinomycetota bacterium]MED6327826.1 NAD(P)H-dependent oxidoreductase [Actinomycetota bacterium]